MEICLSHFSAFRLLMRTKNESPRLRPSRSATPIPERAAPRKQVCELQKALQDTRRTDILVSATNRRRSDDVARSRIPSGPLSPKLFRIAQLADGHEVRLCGPEVVFVQLAADLSFLETVYIGYALCSSYRLDETAKGGTVHRSKPDKPLTTPAKLAAFVSASKGCRGCARARQALPYIKQGSRSPMESALAMGYGLPVRYGGFGLGSIELNREIRIFDGSESGARRYVTRIPDLTITARGRDATVRSVLVDYDADSVHATRAGLASDSKRRNQFAAGNVAAHISITTAQALEFQAYAHVAEQIRLALRRQNPMRAIPCSENPNARKRFETMRARQIELWKTVVCQSAFRKRE